MKILVTGGAGFIASHVVRPLPRAWARRGDRRQPRHRQAREPARRRHLLRGRPPRRRPSTTSSPPSDPRWSATTPPTSTCAGRSPTRCTTPASTCWAASTCLECCRRHGTRKVLYAGTGGAHVRRGRVHPRGRGPPGQPHLALRCQQAHGRALPLHLPGELRPGLHRPAVPQRLRTAAGPARRGRRGGHLRAPVARRNAAHHLRRRHQDPRLLLRGRHRRRRTSSPSRPEAAASTTSDEASRSPTSRSSTPCATRWASTSMPAYAPERPGEVRAHRPRRLPGTARARVGVERRPDRRRRRRRRVLPRATREE